MADAQGSIQVPAAMEVWLIMRPSWLSELAAFPPDAFQMITVENLKSENADLGRIERFTGLRKLTLKGEPVDPAVMDELKKALPNRTITQ